MLRAEGGAEQYFGLVSSLCVCQVGCLLLSSAHATVLYRTVAKVEVFIGNVFITVRRWRRKWMTVVSSAFPPVLAFLNINPPTPRTRLASHTRTRTRQPPLHHLL